MQFLDDYLRQYEVPSGVRVSDGTWKKLFSEVVKRCVSIFMLDYKLVASTTKAQQMYYKLQPSSSPHLTYVDSVQCLRNIAL